ncbi:uncharacterized protein MONBRDRAFT_14603 [Monosiga brevicollis MX1]|uniref:Probable proline--tRNA ligase, mitochondrial n=1 Tax=Monosiga brevicollis TaxID=81824 RepID=A9URY8_MONBE|nr:uncharacterized protein MONBRDRAFT_14603 [Monosiga brevicollis MX1]EDQ92009.1 predicted protein [Monosiga brevicollis MX1]|eukprot:XP_001743295.1 hypothetical protein [Monosiga brevicollis MX1]
MWPLSQLLVQAGYIAQSSSGMYHMLPLAKRVLGKLENLVRAEMSAIGAQEISLSTLTGKDLWTHSGRWDTVSSELFRVEDRRGAVYCLAPTHEEAITTLAKSYVRSARNMPLYLYQLDRKYRDELRPRSGLLRGREFYMKDLYTFDVDEQAARLTYESVVKAYHNLFTHLHVPYVAVEADTGAIGGSMSHEFQVLAPVGEDSVTVCHTCDRAANLEVMPGSEAGTTPVAPTDHCQFESHAGIEVGHTFLLGHKYSSMFDVTYDSPSGPELAFMGCYGLGTSRILAAVTEALASENGLRWPLSLAPYRVAVITLGASRNDNIESAATCLTEQLNEAMPGDVLLDDRCVDLSLRQKIATMRLIGVPYVVVVGSRYNARQLEVYDSHNEAPRKIAVHDLIQLAALPERDVQLVDIKRDGIHASS